MVLCHVTLLLLAQFLATDVGLIVHHQLDPHNANKGSSKQQLAKPIVEVRD